ncbi:branched-chain amino acid aminotransferase [Sporosarcina sp. ANT_H38]|uniref:branched-chain amino acid aminotransferase n=1 Tax=Sporosarcina sp. ANT_H38 TaxID=2597358 RepID=UPI0011F19956|nr:branched-chain amino acid aminotransferase [Sporosarcina sp. ANT_H38]KAA0964849.1 branched-chain amino acid aminotransferase [Sporosarcina sp. ANT_H38]
MLKKQLGKYITENMTDNTIEFFEIDREYVAKHQLIAGDVTVVEKAFQFSVIERCVKETENLIREEDQNFLNDSISYLKNHVNEFVYVEANAFEVIRVDAVVLEFDEVFEKYTALFGLKLQKKFGNDMKAYLDTHLHGDGAKYSVMFSNEDGLWDMNFALDYVEGFSEDLSFVEIYQLMYDFIFKMVDAVDEAQ